MRQGIDFLRGAFLIGATPICVLGVFLLCEQFCRGEVSSTFASAIVVGSLAVTLFGIGWAVWHRIQKRIVSIGFIWLEAAIGLLGAGVFLLFEGLMLRSINNMNP